MFTFGRTGSSLLPWAFSSCGEWGLLSSSGCTGFSLLLQGTGSGYAGYELWRTGSVALRHVESSWTRDGTCVLCTGRQILIYCTTREVLSLFFILSFFSNWSIVDFQYCVNFCSVTRTHARAHTHTYTYTLFFSISFSIMVYHSILNIVLSAVGQDLVVYPFHLQELTSLNCNLPLHLCPYALSLGNHTSVSVS